MQDIKDKKRLYWPINDDSILLLIQYRSLYILKRKFEIFQSAITNFYSAFESPSCKESFKKHTVIDINGFEPLLNSIVSTTNMLILPIIKPNELFIVDLYNKEENDIKCHDTQHEIAIFAKEYIEKYNEIYLAKKFKESEPEPEIPKPKIAIGEEGDNYEWLLEHPMAQYDKKGNLIYNYEQLRERNSLTYENKPPETKEESNKEDINEEENKELEKGKLFAETLPLIVADYIQANPHVVIVDLDRENNDFIEEVRAIFDKDIIQKLAEDMDKLKNEIEEINNSANERLRKLKEQYAVLNKNIELYQKLLLKAEASGDPNAVYIKEILDKLMNEKLLMEAKLIELAGLTNKSMLTTSNNKDKEKDETENNITGLKQEGLLDSSSQMHNNKQSSKESLLAKEERKILALKEIFHFYTNQHNFAGLYPLFETIQSKVNHLDLSEFAKFCVEFQIEISKETLVELFKKNSSNRKNMNYKEYLDVLSKISRAINSNRKQFLTKKIEKLNVQLMTMKTNNNTSQFRRKSLFNSPNRSRDNTDVDNHNSHRVSIKKAAELFNVKKTHMNDELFSYETELEKLNKFTYNEMDDYFYTFLGIDQNFSYRKKMKGFIIPFHNMEERHLFWDNQPHITSLKTIQQNNMKKIEYIKAKQSKEKKQKKLKEDLYQSKVAELKKKNLKLEVNAICKMKDKTYFEINQKQEVQKQIETEIVKEKNKYKYDWEKIEKMDILDELKLDNAKNDNKDLFCDSDNSDDLEILNNLNTKRKEPKRIENIYTQRESETNRSNNELILPKVENTYVNNTVGNQEESNKDMSNPIMIRHNNLSANINNYKLFSKNVQAQNIGSYFGQDMNYGQSIEESHKVFDLLSLVHLSTDPNTLIKKKRSAFATNLMNYSNNTNTKPISPAPRVQAFSSSQDKQASMINNQKQYNEDIKLIPKGRNDKQGNLRYLPDINNSSSRIKTFITSQESKKNPLPTSKFIDYSGIGINKSKTKHMQTNSYNYNIQSISDVSQERVPYCNNITDSSKIIKKVNTGTTTRSLHKLDNKKQIYPLISLKPV